MTERGSGTLLIAAVTAAVVMLTVGLAIIAVYTERTHHARAGADVVALSAAHTDDLRRCAVAARAAQRNDVRLVDCQVAGDQTEFVVTVQVEVPMTVTVPGLPTVVRAKAHAGQVMEVS